MIYALAILEAVSLAVLAWVVIMQGGTLRRLRSRVGALESRLAPPRIQHPSFRVVPREDKQA